jgi:hypothetical protein
MTVLTIIGNHTMTSFFKRTEIYNKERLLDYKLREAFERSRKRHTVTKYEMALIRACYRNELSAINHHARILWGEVISDELSNFFCQGGDGSEHNQDVHFVTLLDHQCARSLNKPLTLEDFENMKLRLRYGLRGLNHLSVIEPALYANLQEGFRFTEKQCMFWHLHGLVWGISSRRLGVHLRELETDGRYLAIADGFRGTHHKLIKQGDLPYVAGYTFKSPAVSYRVSVKDQEKNGLPVINANGEVLQGYIQGKSELRLGERITMFHTMKNLHLDNMALAGGEGSKLLASAKRIALSN